MKNILAIWFILIILSCNNSAGDRTIYFPKRTEIVHEARSKQHVWVFVMAGQSNMAGRGMVEPEDTLVDQRILSINQEGQMIFAKEPLHFYEPTLAGLDCGYSFGKTLVAAIPDSISVLIIPTAVGGSSISQWLGDSVHRQVPLFSNFRDKLEAASEVGLIKAILWHQGESDTNDKNIPLYDQRLEMLFSKFRSAAGNDSLPILLGELGSYSKNNQHWQAINRAIRAYSASDKFTTVISTSDLRHKGDTIHFDSNGQRLMGKRFAQAYIDKFNNVPFK